ncbi:hypothetical protein KKG31_00820 [Patescibacteria group bacterium]|nr:hypothetical protein [Patescibacteria group bacterium]MBU1757725.1 hypothetical protein [Patescibacteria group bacterium]
MREYLNEQLVINNKKLSKDIVAIRPTKKLYSTDNAAMIGVAGIIDR